MINMGGILLVDNLLTLFFSPESVTFLGDYYNIVYSWSHFAVVVALLIVCVFSVCSLFHVIVRLFR